jgi:hypothetical protein
MILDWHTLLASAVATLPPLHREIVVRTMQLPGRRKHLRYTEISNIWRLSRREFEEHKRLAFDSLRRYLLAHGLTSSADLVLR